MIRMATILAAVLAVSGLQAQSDQCEWNMGPPTFGAGTATLDDSPCLDLSPLTVIWLESDGCICVVDMRIVGTYKSCNSVWTTIGQNPGGCETYSYDLAITAASSSQGNFMGTSQAGMGGNQPPPLFFVDMQTVPCDDVFVFAMVSSCSCFQEVTDRTTLMQPPRSAPSGPGFVTANATTGQPVRAVQVTQTYMNVTCTSGETNGEFSAYCVQDCSPQNPADPIPIEGQ